MLASGKNSIPPPDFLSADVVGLGYDVFLGAKETLGTHVLGVIDNVLFHRIHNGQKTIHDHCEFLDELGFDFVGFQNPQEFSSFRAPVGQRGKGHLIGVDALFLRRPDTLEAMFPDNDHRYVKCCKLAFTALRFGYVEFALDLIDAASHLKCNDVTRAKVAAMSYGRFLEQLGRTAAAMPRWFPPIFSELYTVEQSRNRFVSAQTITHSGLKGWLKARLLPHTRLLGGVRRVRRVMDIVRAKIRAIFATTVSLISPRYSAFERILADHGLAEVAELVRDNRLRY